MSECPERARAGAAPALAVAVALAALGPGACRGAKQQAPPARRGPIVATGRDLLPVPVPTWEDLDPKARELVGRREANLQERLSGGGSPGPGLALAYGDLGKVYHAFGYFESAVACYENAGRLSAAEFAWPYLLGRVLAQLERRDEAMAAVERALANQPTSLPARVFLGDLQRTTGRLDEARATYREALRGAPDSAAAWFGLGQVAVLQAEPREAVACFEKALRAQPDANRVHYPLALAYTRLGDQEQARRHLTQRGEAEPVTPDPLLDAVVELNPYTWAQRGLAALGAGRLGRAVPLLRSAADAFPDNVEVRLHLAAALALAGSPGEALVHYREALRLQPANPHAHYNLGTLLLELDRVQDAVSHLRKAIDLRPEYPEALLNLAQALRRLGRDEEALAPLDQALRLDPVDLKARVARARVLARLGRCADAVASLDPAGELPRGLAEPDALVLLLAACPEGAGRDPGRAQRLARTLFASGPSAQRAASVARAEAAGGHWSEAERWQRRALELLPADAPPAGREELTGQLASYRQHRPVQPDW